MFLALSALVAAASVALPVAPVSVAAGDLDGDGSAEIVALMYWPSWGTTSRTVSATPGTIDIEVVPALKERRELRAFRLTGDALSPVAEPLVVGSELLGLAGVGRAAPVLVLTKTGAAKLALERDSTGRAVLSVQSIHSQNTVFRSADAPLRTVPMVQAEGGPWMVLSTAKGITAVAADAKVRAWESPLRVVRSGSLGTLVDPIPRAVDVDRDGTLDLLETGSEDPRGAATRIALRRGLGDGQYASAQIWNVGPLLRVDPAERAQQLVRRLEDVVDSDGDGTLDAVITAADVEADGIKEAVKWLRGQPRALEFVPLLPDGRFGTDSMRRATVRGFPMPLPNAGGGRSAFRDLDADGRLDYVTLTLDIGTFGIVRAAMSGTLKTSVTPLVFRGVASGFRELAGAVPEINIRFDLRRVSFARFLDFPDDLDGDGRLDMTVCTDDELQVYAGQADGSFSKEPSLRIPFDAPPRGDDSVWYLDLDGTAPLDVIAIADDPSVKRDRSQDDPDSDPVIPARLMVRRVGVPP
ncbi:MAG: FG-GAP-like repeat-containing protein [Acidobacteriota bacterium]